MSESNSICFYIPEKSKSSIIHAETSDDIRDVIGQIRIKVNGEVITKGSITLDFGNRYDVTVGYNRIIEFASELLDTLPKILEEKTDAESTIIEHGEDPWEFHFKKKGNNINCSIFWQPDEVFLHQDQIIPVKEYCFELLKSTKEIGDLMLQNSLCKTFDVYNNEFEPAKRTAINTIINKGILNQGELEGIFSKEYINRVIPPKKGYLNDRLF